MAAKLTNPSPEKPITDISVGWDVEHFPYHLTLLKLAPHHFWVRVGNVKRCRPKLFFGAPGVTTNPATVLEPTAQPTARTVVSSSLTPSAPKKSLGRHFRPSKCRPKLFFGALGVTDEPTTVLGPRAQPTGRTSFALLKIPTAPKKKIGSATSNLYVADPNSGSVQCALERKCT